MKLTIHSIKDKSHNVTKISLGNTSIFYEPGVNIKIDNESKVITINQLKAGSKVYLLNGELKNYLIKYFGHNIIEGEKKISLKVFPPDFPINNIALLDACLSLI